MSAASIIRQATDDKTLETLLRRFGLLHTADGVLGCVYLIVLFLLSPSVFHCMHTHTHSWIKTAIQARGQSSLGDYLPTFHPSASNPPRGDSKTSFPLSSSLSLGLTLARVKPESLAWTIFCFAVSLMTVNITQPGMASKLPCRRWQHRWAGAKSVYRLIYIYEKGIYH